MQLALLVGANPRVCKEGPLVRLSKGFWNIRCVGVVDSELHLHAEGSADTIIPLPNNVPPSIGGDRNVSLSISKAGSELFIGVFAELME